MTDERSTRSTAAPTMAPISDPLPPRREQPPNTAAVMAYISYVFPAVDGVTLPMLPASKSAATAVITEQRP